MVLWDGVTNECVATHFYRYKEVQLSLTVSISLEEDGLSLEQQDNSDWIWSLRSPGILGTEELIGFVHCLKPLLKRGGGER